MYDFKAFGESRIKVINDLRFIRYEANNEMKCYKRVNKGSNKFHIIMNTIENIKWI